MPLALDTAAQENRACDRPGAQGREGGRRPLAELAPVVLADARRGVAARGRLRRLDFRGDASSCRPAHSPHGRDDYRDQWPSRVDGDDGHRQGAHDRGAGGSAADAVRPKARALADPPQRGRPIAVSLISAHGPVTLSLSASLVARLGPAARLAASIEPPGGSPTGAPTGPVVAAGCHRRGARSRLSGNRTAPLGIRTTSCLSRPP